MPCKHPRGRGLGSVLLQLFSLRSARKNPMNSIKPTHRNLIHYLFLFVFLLTPLTAFQAQSVAIVESAPLAAPLAQTPPMGWNHYNMFGNSINETTLRAIADAMVTHGMVSAGYVYFN